jgi:zinc protease
MRIRKLLVPAAFALLIYRLLGAVQAQAMEVVFETDANLPVVYLNVAVKAGSANDPEGQAGLSNFMGEMLLRGTRARTKEQLDLALDQMGAQLDFETRAEALILRGAVLSSQLEPFLALLSEIVTEPSFPDAEIRKLKSEVVSGLLEELGRDSTLGARRFNSFLFRGHPYGKPILGTIKEVEALGRDAIISQYELLFRDVNMLVVGTGDAKRSAIESWSKALGKAREGGKAIEKVAPPENAPERRLQIVDKPDRTQAQIHIGQIGARMTDPGFFPLYLGNYAFGGTSFSARLMVEVRVKRGWAYGAYSSFRHGRQPRLWVAQFSPAEKDAAAALAHVTGMIRELKDKGVTAEEFGFAQRSLVNGAGFMFNTPQKRVENRLLERTLDLPDGFMQAYGPELQKVKLEEVNAALKRFVEPDRLAISVVGTAKNLKEPLAKAAGLAPDKVVVSPYNE